MHVYGHPKWFASITIAFFLTFSLLISTANATEIVVTTTVDEINTDGDCSLREAIDAANLDQAIDGCAAGDGMDILIVPAGRYSITLENTDEDKNIEDGNQRGDYDLVSAMHIHGSGVGATVLTSDVNDRLFHVHISATVEISGITISGASAPHGISATESDDTVTDGQNGGGILNGGSLVLRRALVSHCSSGAGGSDYQDGLGIFYDGAPGHGGGIYNLGEMVLVQSAIVHNTTWTGGGEYALHYHRGSDGGDGAGIFNTGAMTLYNSTVSNNVAASGTGVDFTDPLGIYHYEAGSGGSGGGIHNTGIITLSNGTISHNRAGEGLSGGPHPGSGDAITNGQGAITVLQNTIVAGATDNTCSGNTTFHNYISHGYNLLQNSCAPQTADALRPDLLSEVVSTLSLTSVNNTLPVHPLAACNPALDAGICEDIHGEPLLVDQLNLSRPAGERCDIGAYEDPEPMECVYQYLPITEQ